MLQKLIAKLSDKEKKILYFTFILVFLAFFDRLLLGPVNSKLKAYNEDIDSKEEGIKRDLRFLSYKEQILQENKSLSKYYTVKQRTEEEIIAAFLKKLEGMASKSQINLIRVSPSEGDEKQGRKEYLANLECNGKLKDVVSFMYMVNSSEELLKIVKLSINTKKSSPDIITASMTINKTIVKAAPAAQPTEVPVQKMAATTGNTK